MALESIIYLFSYIYVYTRRYPMKFTIIFNHHQLHRHNNHHNQLIIINVIAAIFAID